MVTQLIDPQAKIVLPEQGHWTYADWVSLPDDGYRYEILDGVLYMSPPPTVVHQNVVSGLMMWMRKYAVDNELGLVLTAPIGVYLPGQPVPVQPDILFISKARSGIVQEAHIKGAPDLVVEVLSPSNWVYDRGKKREVYEKGGVLEYWIVDDRSKTVEVFVLENETYRLLGQFSNGDVAYSTVSTGFKIAANMLF